MAVMDHSLASYYSQSLLKMLQLDATVGEECDLDLNESANLVFEYLSDVVDETECTLNDESPWSTGFGYD